MSLIQPQVDRRAFVRGIAAVGGAVLTNAALGSCGRADEAHHHVLPVEPDLAVGGGNVSRVPLRIPPTMSPSGVTLRAAPAAVGILPGKTTTAWTYNGLLPGPTFSARRGDRLARIIFAPGSRTT